MSAESQLDSASNAASDIQIPSTPTPQNAALPTSQTESAPTLASPPHRSPSGEMTPPPSSQVLSARSPLITARPLSLTPQLPASPPATVKVNSTISVPNADEIVTASEHELRNMVRDLAGAVREARMSAAHFKLQHSLLSMESHESAQRAEIEHQMTRREVEVLQADHRPRQRSTQTPQAQLISPQSATNPMTIRCRDLELDNATLERRLRKAKTLIEDERDRADLLMEENLLLKRRIRENRDHYTRMKSQSPAFISPHHEFMTPQRRALARFPDTGDSQGTGSQDNIAVLLAADQLMNGEPITVPSTPTKTPASKLRHGHVRGAHSLSSLQSSPSRSQPTLFERSLAPPSRIPFSSVPSSQIRAEVDRHDRDSTISISEDEAEDRNDEAVTDEELPQSQASSLATSMLRRNPGVSQEAPSGTSASAEKQSNLLQTKLFGPVKKAGGGRSPGTNGKRSASFGEMDVTEKKKKLKIDSAARDGGVGLGIGSWGSPRR